MITTKSTTKKTTAIYHLPGLFEFYELYRVFLPLFREHREYFYGWCEIGSIYGAPQGCMWGGGRVSTAAVDPSDVLALMADYGISARLTFSNSLLRPEHLTDKRCNQLCALFEGVGQDKARNSQFAAQPDAVHHEPGQKFNSGNGISCGNGVIVHSDLLLHYLRETFPSLYFVSSTTKVLTDFEQFRKELQRKEFRYVVPDFRLNKDLVQLETLTGPEKEKVEFLCNECCWFGCADRKACYETVSRKNLGEDCPEHICKAPGGGEGYRFSKAMENPGFIGIHDIQSTYLPMGFSNFKIEGRGLGSAVVLEFILYYMTKPEHQLRVREAIYLDSMLDLF